MANLRQVLSALVAVLCLSFPSLAHAQRVHEVRPAPAGEVRIGTEANASLDEIVVLARRITGDAELTTEDVIMNNDHVRYVCRAHHRQLYFGTDSSYGGNRCPDDASRYRGVLRDSVYRVPITHGSMLVDPGWHHVVSNVSPPTPAPVVNQTSDAEARELAALRAAVEQSAADLAAVRTSLRIASEERDAARNAPPRTVTVTQVVAEHATPWELALAVLLAIAITLASVYALYRRRFMPRFELKLKDVNTAWEKKLEDEVSAIRVEEREKAQVELDLLRPKLALYDRGRRIWKIWHDVTNLKFEELRQKYVLLETKHQAEREAFERRKSEITVNNLEIASMRKMLEVPESLRHQILEYQHRVVTALEHGEQAQADEYRAAIGQCEAQRKLLHFDPEEVQARLQHVLTEQQELFAEQCGLRLDGSALDEWRADLEHKTRDKYFEAEAKRTAYEVLHVIHQADLATKQEALQKKYADMETNLTHQNEVSLGEKLVALEAEYGARAAEIGRQLAESQQREAALRGDPQAQGEMIFAMEATIAELREELGKRSKPDDDRWSVPAEPSSGSLELPIEDDGQSVPPQPRVRQRKVTGPIARASYDLDVTKVAAPAPRREDALLRELENYLKLLEQSGNGGSATPKRMVCSDEEARNWAFLVENVHIQSSFLTDVPRLRSYAAALKKAGKEQLLKKRRDTNRPPPAPTLG
jgi:hypothetical protein